VGIGTSTPGHPLTVQAGTSSTSPLLGFYSSAGADKFNFSLAGGGLNLSESGVAGGRLFVQPGGNVGIGTIAPAASALLDLTSTSKGLLPRAARCHCQPSYGPDGIQHHHQPPQHPAATAAWASVLPPLVRRRPWT